MHIQLTRFQLLCNFYLVADPIGGGLFPPPDRTVCGPPPLEANLFAFCKGSLIYKRYVWVLPVPYPLFPVYHTLFPIACFPPYPLPTTLPIAKSFFAFHEEHIRKIQSILDTAKLSLSPPLLSSAIKRFLWSAP